jgi:MFS family permease
VTNRSPYRSVLRRGDVLSALVPYVLARLPLTMAPLALLLLTQSETGSYHRAGVVSGLYAVAVALAGPVLGRLIDRHGQSPVLLATGLVHPVAMVGAAFAAYQHQYALLIVAAITAGASLPPVAACMRALWTRLLQDEESRKAGFAIEGVVVEVAELSGPLLIALLLATGRATTAVGLAGVLMGAAALSFRMSRASRDAPTHTVRIGRWGPLAVPRVRRLLLVVAASTATIGALEVAITGYARHHGGLASAGLYIGLISVGGIVAGALFGGTERFSRHRAPLLAGVLLASAAAAAALAEVHNGVLVLACLFVFGGAVAVGVVLQLATMADITSDATRTEAFTWGGTANFVGLGLGTALSGWALDRFGLATAFYVSAMPMILAAFVTLVSQTSFSAAEPAVEEPVLEEAVEVEPVAVEVEPVAVEVEPVAVEVEPVAVEVEPVGPDVAALADEVATLRAHIADLEWALDAALMESPSAVLDDARERSRKMLERVDAACLEMRDRATDDADGVRAAATNASIAIMASAERDARALLARARREADGIISRARRSVADDDEPSATITELPRRDDERAAGT